MPNIYMKEAQRTQHTKVQKLVGHTDGFRHGPEKAADMAYYENQNLDDLTVPEDESVGPMSSERTD